jgi:hypothetical protein
MGPGSFATLGSMLISCSVISWFILQKYGIASDSLLGSESSNPYPFT